MLARQVGCLISALHSQFWEDFEWAAPADTLVGVVKRGLKAMGWVETGNWMWQADEIGCLDLSRTPSCSAVELRSKKKKAAHLVREGWRRWCWQKVHTKGMSRHDFREAAETSTERADAYNEPRVRLVRKAASTGDTTVLSILAGSYRTPACMQGRGDEVLTRCPCCTALGSQRHIFWECEQVREELHTVQGLTRPRTPEDGWQRRFAWPRVDSEKTENGRRYNADVLQWCRAVVLMMRDKKYGNSERQLRIEAAINRRVDELARKAQRSGDLEWMHHMKREVELVGDFKVPDEDEDMQYIYNEDDEDLMEEEKNGDESEDCMNLA